MKGFRTRDFKRAINATLCTEMHTGTHGHAHTHKKEFLFFYTLDLTSRVAASIYNISGTICPPASPRLCLIFPHSCSYCLHLLIVSFSSLITSPSSIPLPPSSSPCPALSSFTVACPPPSSTHLLFPAHQSSIILPFSLSFPSHLLFSLSSFHLLLFFALSIASSLPPPHLLVSFCSC